MLVVAPPWDGGAEQVVETAGGRVVGPGSAPFSVLATGATPAAYELAGAWLVLDPAVLEILCGNKDTR
ncbi:hypothetical protein Rumeso_00635 [Rubellimicrobium mesophilum DSM 19309]|uniref:Uncharacterized protein n=1 Tax=Rubellimicrobium mesophilum DSM 19309 TaxID=442562 RepID=A0A017HUR7_9RHOB|nr:hypothetical protein Rumeso_00635 [Rubellimicrobium mesophilum DSM 19309]